MEKKNIAIILLAVGLGASGVGNLILAVQLGFIELEEEEADILLFGTTAGPDDLDPHTCYDTTGSDVIEQVCEGLYKFDISDPNYALTPNLALGMPTLHGNELSIALREGVTFHDGTAFNASVVKWNFDRLSHFLNYSDNDYLPAPFNESLPDGIAKTQFANLIEAPNITVGGPNIPLINETKVVSNYVVNITLNLPRASFFNLFPFSGLYMLSPAATPPNRYIEVYEKIVGTGPFIYDYYVGDVEVSLLANENYWQGAPQIDGAKFVIFTTDTAENEAMLAGDIDISDSPNPTYLDAFDDSPDMTLLTGGNMLNTNFMPFNAQLVNQTWRKAMSWAVNYSYILEIDWLGQQVRLASPIPGGIAYSNYSHGAVLDLSIARATVQSMGMGIGFTLDSEWLAVADGGSPFYTITIKVDSEDTDAINQCNTVANSFRYIGVKATVDASLTFNEIVSLIFSDHSQLELFSIGWKPDYLDPENYVNFFFDSTSIGNIGPFVNSTVDALLAAGMVELDYEARKLIYWEIQRLIAGVHYVHLFISTGINNDVVMNNVKGWIQNSISAVRFYPVYFE